MAFSDFKYPEIVAQFGLQVESVTDLFQDVPPLAPSATLEAALPIGMRLGTSAHTEASRATWMVGPVLSDFWWRYQGRITLIGGAEFAADPAAGLNGYCDFIIGLAPQQTRISAPVLIIFEAKRDSIPDGLAQCVAGMIGMQRYNRREGRELDPVYGCVTTGSLWKFLRLSEHRLSIDLTEYTLNEAPKLLGIMTHMVGPVVEKAAA